MGPFAILNLPDSYRSRTALAVAFFSYLVGFGVTGTSMGLAKHYRETSKTVIMHEYVYSCLRRFLTYPQIELFRFMLLENGFNASKPKDLERLAKRLNMPIGSLQNEYMHILEKILDISTKYFDEINNPTSA